jgi:hypothetical protein
MFFAFTLIAGAKESSSRGHRDDSEITHPGQSDRDRDGERDRDHGRDRDKRNDPRDRDDGRHDHGKPKPPHPPHPSHPPKPPRDYEDGLAAPTGLTAEAVSLFQVNLTWTDNSTNELGFKIERSLDGTTFTQIAQVLPNTTTYRDINRFPDTKYFYRARAFNAQGHSAYSMVARTQTPAPNCSLSLYGWGYGALPPGLDNVVAIAAGGNGSAVLKRNGTVLSWQHYGSVVDPCSAGVSNVVSIAAGYDHVLALHANGRVSGWGQNSFGQASIPITLTNVVAMAAGGTHSLALRSDGTVVAWGDNTYQQCAVPGGLTGVVAVAAGNVHSVALRSDGTVVSWGTPLSQSSRQLDSLSNVVAVATGSYFGMALHGDGRVSTWAYGERTIAAAPLDLTNAVSIAVGELWNVALRDDGSLAVWDDRSWFGTPPTNLTTVVACSVSGWNLLALTEAPVMPVSLTSIVLATNRVGLIWSTLSPAAESILIQRTTNLTWQFPSGQLADWQDLTILPGTATAYEDVTTQTNQTYWYRLVVQNACGSSVGALAYAAIRPPVYEPSLQGQAFADAAILSLLSPNDGRTEIDLERAADPDGVFGPWEVVATVSATNLMLPFTNSGLMLNSTYWYRARERNGLGESPYSQPVAVTIVAPAIPSNLSVQIGTTNQIVLSWYGGQVGDEAGFKIERATDLDGFPINWTEVGVVSNGMVRTFSDAVPGGSGTAYWYRLRSYNVLGDSAYSLPVSVTLEPPSKPVISGQNYGTTALVNWYLSYAATDTHFDLERTRGENGTPEAWQFIATGTNFSDWYNIGTYSDPGLVPGETYRYRVRISNWLGESDFSVPASITILPPLAPSIYSIGVGGSNYLTLSWWMNYVGTPAGVRLERAPDNNHSPGVWSEIANLTNLITVGSVFPNEPLPYYNDSNVVAGATYWYRLRAYDAAGISEYSNPIYFRVALPWMDLQLSGYSFAASARLQWQYPMSANRIEGFNLQRAPDLNGAPGAWSHLATLSSSAPYRFYYPLASVNYFTNAPLSVGTYWYRVVPFSWTGEGEPSQAVAITIRPPSAGSSLTAVVGNTQQVVLRWFGPLNNDSDEVEIEHAPNAGGMPGDWALLARYNWTNEPSWFGPHFVVTNVVANTTNWYRLRVFNSLGYSPYLGPAEARTVAPPPAPTNLRAINQGDFIALNWFNDYDYGYISDFELQRAVDADGSPGEWTPLAIVPGGEASYFSYNDDKLTPATQYWYRIRARNWLGQSAFSAAVSISVPPLPVPSITGLRIGQSNEVRLDLSVNYTTYGQRGYRIERASTVSDAPGEWSEIGTSFATGTAASFTDTDAAAFGDYWYRVRTVGIVGLSDPSNPQRLRVVPPRAPQASVEGLANRVTLSWYASAYSSYGFVAGIHIERATDPGNWVRVGTVPVGGPNAIGTFTETLPATNGFYWYRLQAFNWIGGGDYRTNFVSVGSPLPPQDIAAAIGGTNRVKITWYSYFAGQEGFKVERASDVNGQPGAWAQLAAFPDSSSYFHGFTDTNVGIGTTNWYRVRSYSVIGDSQPSPMVSVALVPPPAPGLLAVPFANRVDLSWSGDYERYGLVQQFELERAGDANGVPGEWSGIALLAGTVRSYTDGGRPPDSRSWYRVRARNWLGASAYSDPVSATIVPPAGPQWVTALIGDTNQVSLTLQATSPYEQDGYKIDRASETNNVPGVWELLGQVVASNQSVTVFIDSNVLAFTTNWYRARAFNAAGTSTNSVPLQLAIVPPPPVGYFTVTTFANQAHLTWDDSLPNYGRIQGFRIERADDDQGNPGDWTQIAAVPIQNPPDYAPWPLPISHLSLVDSNLTAHAAYWYRVRADNWVGPGTPTVPVRVEIVPPVAPANLRTVVGLSNSVELEWMAGASNDQEGYLVERAFDVNGSPGSWMEIATVTNNVEMNWPWIQYPRYSDPEVSANTTLWYRIRAYSIVGRSDYCAPVRIVLSPPPALTFYQSAVVGDRVDLGWSAPSSYSYGAVSGYRLERAVDAGGGPGLWSEIAAPFSPLYQDMGLTAGQYWYRVKAYNWIGAGSFSTPISVAIVPPNAPQYLQAVVGTTNQIVLSWSSGTPTDQDGFQLELASDVGGTPGDWQLLATIPATNSYSASFTQTNAVAYTPNWYRVRAFNRVGFSAYGAPLQFVVVPPPDPIILELSQWADQITLTCRSYTFGDVSGFEVERALDEDGTPGVWMQLGASPATNSFCGWWDSSFTDSGLTLNTGYWYRVRAFNWVGESEYSSPTFREIVGPATPSALRLRIGNTNQITVFWYPQASDIVGFELERAPNLSGVPGNWQPLITITTGLPYFEDTNIIAGETYWYRARAFNSLGYSAYNSPASIAVLPPPPPSRLNASRFANTVEFNWGSLASSYGNIAGFKLERAPDLSGTPGNWAEIQNIPAYYWSSYGAEDTNLTAHTTYWYRIRSYNWLGDGDYSPATNLTIIPPAAPTGLVANRAGNSAIELWWTAAPPRDQDGFKVERRTDSAAEWAQIAFVPATNRWSSYYTDTNFVPNVTNYYRVRAFNVVGDSPYSSTVKAIIHLPNATIVAPTLPWIGSLTLTNNDVLITWTASGGTTNVVEATASLHADFAPISPSLALEGDGNVTTNFLDAGALTNAPVRFYRIRAIP